MLEFPPQFFAKNRKALIKQVEADVIVVTANGHLQRNGDNVFPFRQDSNFWYLTGIDLADVIWVYNCTAEEEWLIMPERSEYEQIFDGSISDAHIAEQSAIKDVMPQLAGWQRLNALLNRKTVVATPEAPPAYVKPYNIYSNPARQSLEVRLREAKVQNFVDIREPLALLRQIKQPVEISALRQAIDITCQTIAKDVLPKLEALHSENGVEALLTSGYRRRGAQGHSFHPIVASGRHACTLHYLENNASLAQNEFVLIDTGAEVNNYAADITRCYPVGYVSERHKEVYRAVYNAQQSAIAAIKPKVTFRQLDTIANEALEAALKQLKLKPIGDKNLLRSYYPHAWHWLGLDVHDVGDYERPLKPGMVLTVEPGLYIAAEGIGVRLEDDVLVTKTGHEVLSAALSADPAHVFAK